MPNQEKVEKVARLKERIEGSTALLLADYRGLTTADVTDLRRNLDETATRFAIVKNTLMQLAAEEAGLGNVSELMQGPTAVGFVGGDAVTAAKRLLDAAKRYPALELKGAWVEGRLLSAAEAQRLATLDSREAMLSKVAGLAKSEMSKAAGMFQALQGRFLGILEAYRDKLPGEAAPETETAPEAAAQTEVAPEVGSEGVASSDPGSAEEELAEGKATAATSATEGPTGEAPPATADAAPEAAEPQATDEGPAQPEEEEG